MKKQKQKHKKEETPVTCISCFLSNSSYYITGIRLSNETAFTSEINEHSQVEGTHILPFYIVKTFLFYCEDFKQSPNLQFMGIMNIYAGGKQDKYSDKN